MSYSVDVLIIGAGVVGLAVARALARSGHDVIVMEQHSRIGEETSSRNSGVIHSGIYYPTESLKATLCVRGRDLLYGYCEDRGIEFIRTGKIIVAQQNQMRALHDLYERGLANGLTDVQFCHEVDIKRLEPQLRCAGGLYVPSAGILDVHALLMSLWADLEQSGATVAFRSEFLNAHVCDQGLLASVRNDGREIALKCRWLINCAGLHAARLLTRIEDYPESLYRKAYLAKGNYFQFTRGKPFSHLVYPMPEKAGLGIHATLDLDGSVRFGPDVEWTDTVDYHVDVQRVQAFYDAIRAYWPSLPPESLMPAYAGIRPKIVGSGKQSADFIIEDQSAHKVAGLINLLGIESPGLTSCLAIAESITDLVSAHA